MSDVGRAGYAPGYPRGSGPYRRLQAALLCVGIAMFAQLYAPQGVLTEAARSLRVTADQSALLISAATIGLAMSVLPWSWVADRIGRLAAMRVSLVAALILGLGAILWPDYAGVLVLRVLQGVALGGTPALALTYLQEAVRNDDAPRAAGTYIAGTTIGGMVGRLLAAPIAAAVGWRVGVGAVEVLCAVAAAAFIILAPSAASGAAAAQDGAGAAQDPRSGRRGHANGERQANRSRASRQALRAHLLRRPMLVLYAQGFALMGSFVTIYNYLAFRLTGAPYFIPASVASLCFLAYLAGTWSSSTAGAVATRRGRLIVLLASAAIMVLGLLLLMTPWLPMILVGLVVMTVGFFGAHAIASGWTAARASIGRAQAASIYNLAYYLGSSLVGWLGGVVFTGVGWETMVLGLIGLTIAAAASAAATLR